MRTERAKTEPTTPAQLKYPATLVEKVSSERFDAEFAKAVKDTGIEPHAPRERTVTAAKRLSKAAAR